MKDFDQILIGGVLCSVIIPAIFAIIGFFVIDKIKGKKLIIICSLIFLLIIGILIMLIVMAYNYKWESDFLNITEDIIIAEKVAKQARLNAVRANEAKDHALFAQKKSQEIKEEVIMSIGLNILEICKRYSDGNWKVGERNGYGVWILENGEEYIGNWKENEMEGYGIHVDENGNQYIGNWKKGKKDIYGVYILVSNIKYEGEWKEEERTGYGVQTGTDGHKYEGEWKENRYDGYGIYSWETTSTEYKGEWKESKRNGYGVLTFTNGDKYEGEWKNGKMDGYGILYDINGKKIKIGKWENGEFIE
jgi:hypothetical protein